MLAFCILGFGLAWTWHGPAGSQPPAPWVEWMVRNCALWQLTAAHFYWVFIHGQRPDWIERGLVRISSRVREVQFWTTYPLDRLMVILGVIMPLATLPGRAWTIPGSIAWALIAAAAAIVIVAGTRNTLRCIWWESVTFAALVWLTALAALIDANTSAVTAALHLDLPRLLPYTVLGPALMTQITMSGHLVRGRNEAEAQTSSLERLLKQREAELAESYARLREAEQQQTLNEERRRLTQDMHDGLGSSLVTALRVAQKGTLSTASMEEVLRGCITDLKLTIDSMEPVNADLLLLLGTLRFRLGPRLTEAGVELLWEVTDVPKVDWLDARNSLHILRILQEAFANILKHTRASQIRVTTAASGDGWLSVTIADNGTGFDTTAAQSGGGRGLANQRRRAEAIGGEIVIASSPEGTRLSLRIPEMREAT
jgi:signal transduction histidine kinase